MTKKEALTKAGYSPKMGRPPVDDSSLSTGRNVRIPDNIWIQMPEPRSEWVRGAIKQRIERDSK